MKRAASELTVAGTGRKSKFSKSGYE